jgi:predicted O-methyltransferase YrrM
LGENAAIPLLAVRCVHVVMLLRVPIALRRFIAHRSVGHSSNFGKVLSKQQQEYTSAYLSACAFEPPRVSHVSFLARTRTRPHDLNLTLEMQVRQLIESKRPPLPEISISAAQGMLLHMLAQSAPSQQFVDVGTLGGYSAAWLACAACSAEGGLVWTVERDAARASFAEQNLAAAGLGPSVKVLNEPALEAIPKLCRLLQPKSVGLVFLDAKKSEYIAYFQLLEDLVAPVRWACAAFRRGIAVF